MGGKRAMLAVLIFPLLGLSPLALPEQMYGVGSGTGTNGSTLYRVDSFTGAPVRIDIADTGRILSDLAITPNGNAYAISGSGLYQIDLTDGSITLLFTIAAAQNSLEAATDTTLYSWGFDNNLYKIDLSTNTLTTVLDTGHSGADLALDLNGRDLYGSTFDGDLIRIDLISLAVTTVGHLSVTGGLRVPGLDFDRSGQLYALSGSDGSAAAEVYAVDKATADTTLQGDISGVGAFGMSIIPSPAPVGGSLTGVSPTKAICRNVTTRQRVIIRDGASTWDCEAAGLSVMPGDTIQLAVTGTANPPPPGVGGSVTGISPTKVICRNKTTTQRIIIKDGALVWDCEAAGLSVVPGDIIQQTIRGGAD